MHTYEKAAQPLSKSWPGKVEDEAHDCRTYAQECEDGFFGPAVRSRVAVAWL